MIFPGTVAEGRPEGPLPASSSWPSRAAKPCSPEPLHVNRDSEQAGRPTQPCSHHVSVRATAGLREGLTPCRAHTCAHLILIAALRVGVIITPILHQNHPPFRVEKTKGTCPGSQDRCPDWDGSRTPGVGLRSLCRTQACSAQCVKGRGAAGASRGAQALLRTWSLGHEGDLGIPSRARGRGRQRRRGLFSVGPRPRCKALFWKDLLLKQHDPTLIPKVVLRHSNRQSF